MKLLAASIVPVCLVNLLLHLGADGFLLSDSSPQPYLRRPLQVSEIEQTGWQMVFRASSGNGHDVYDAWTKGAGVTTVKPVSMERSYDSHYRDEKVSNWASLGAEYVKVGLYKQSTEVAYVIFDGSGTDNVDWFANDRIVASSWSGVTALNTFEYVSIPGFLRTLSNNTVTYKRTFYIGTHDGCDGDNGHLVVLEIDGLCNWEQNTAYPQFVYSDVNGAEIWDKRQYGRADYFAIFVNAEQTT